jgi:ubiquinone biosynthesis protein UbiJ
MSFGKSSSTTTPTLTQEQKDQIAAQTGFFTGTIAPTYKGAVEGATDIYNTNREGVLNAAQQQGSIASQAEKTLGETGESALRTGVTGLESLFSPDYEAKQVAAALAPSEAQYMQNIANQKAQFGGAGELGSAREALAERQTAGQTMATQAATAAQVAKDIAAQRAATGTNLAQIGQGGIGQGLAAAGTQVTAAMTPQDLYNKYASVIFGTPSASYNPNFAGTQGQTKTGTSLGISI